MAATVRRLNEKGVKVYVIGQSPGYYNDVQTIYAKNRYGPQAEKASAPLCFSRDVNGKLQSALPRDVFIDPLPTLCNPTECVYREHGQYLMADQGHFSVFGSKVAVSRYFPFFSGR